MLDDALKQRIQANRFAEGLRFGGNFNQTEFDALCADLHLLAEQWRGETQIDQELAGDLYVQITVIRNMAESFAPNGDGPMWDAYMEIDRLLLEDVFYVPDALRTYVPEPPK